MLTVRKADERGTTRLAWLDSRHSFSFGRYVDRAWMGFGPLRVINDDHVAPGAGFATHPHQNMEIVSVVLRGAMEHKDSTGGGGVIRPGDVQRMSAGTGVEHSEFNHDPAQPLHLVQIWIEPSHQGTSPSYEQRSFAIASFDGALVPIVAHRSYEHRGALQIGQDARIFRGRLHATALGDRGGGGTVSLTLDRSRRVYVHVLVGSVELSLPSGRRASLSGGDGAAIEREQELEVTLRAKRGGSGDVLVFDLP